MTDFDFLSEAIYGMHHQRSAEAIAALVALGIQMPCQISAIYNGIRPLSEQLSIPHSLILLDRIHQGLSYSFCDPMKNQDWLQQLQQLSLSCGKSFLCEYDQDLLTCLRAAINSLREIELAQHQQDGTIPTQDSEQHSRQCALQWLRSPNRKDGLIAMEQWLHIVLLRSSRKIHGIRRRLIEFLSCLSLDYDSSSQLDSPFEQAAQSILKLYAFQDIRSQFPLIIINFLNHLPDYKHLSQLSKNALAFMERAANEDISLKEVAAQLQVHPSYLSRRIKSETGKSVVQHLQAMRVALAQEQLQLSDTPILPIALDCGFPSLEHFHRTFKKLTGVTPRQWRLQYKQV